MLNTDEYGNKLPQVRISKKVFSYNMRERRIMAKTASQFEPNPKHCNICGFRIRSKNHKLGKHHKDMESEVTK